MKPGHSALFDAKGRLIRLPKGMLDDLGMNYDALGAPRFGARRLNYASRLVSADPAAHLASAIVDGGEGAGIQFPLNGTWTSTDFAGAYPYIVWPLEDVFGAPLGGVFSHPVQLWLYLRGTRPAPTDEFRVGFALVNESDLTTATIDGKGCGIIGTGVGDLAVENQRINNGTCNVTTGATNATIVGATETFAVVGASGTTNLDGMNAYGLTSAAVLVNAAAQTGALTGWGNPARVYLAMYAGRTSVANVNAFTVAADVYVSPVLRHQQVT